MTPISEKKGVMEWGWSYTRGNFSMIKHFLSNKTQSDNGGVLYRRFNCIDNLNIV